MPKNTATLALNGEVGLREFAKAVAAFSVLMRSLSAETSNGVKTRWLVHSLDVSSAIATVRGVAENANGEDSIERAIDAYEEVGRAAQDHKVIPYGDKVRRSVSRIESLLNGKILSVRFETEGSDSEIFSPSTRFGNGKKAIPEIVNGAAEGRIQSMSSRGGLRFTLYDVVDDHAISCYLNPGSEDRMRDAWGKFAVVEGTIRRNPITGLITTIRDVSQIDIVDDDHAGGWREAMGCAPATENSISPEEAIRRMRDA